MRLQAVDRAERLPPIFDDPALGALSSSTRISLAPVHGAFDLVVPEPGSLRVSPALPARPGARLLLRYGLELAWLSRLSLEPAAAALLAMSAAGRASRLLPRAERQAALEDPALPAFLALADGPPEPARLLTAWRHLHEAGQSDTRPDAASLATVARLWQGTQPLEALLIDGGDERLDLDGETGLNRYLCAPCPQPGVIAFSSCTASFLAQSACEAAEHARQALVRATLADGSGPALRAASRRVTDALLAHFNVADLAETVLAASGTDAALLLTGLLAAEQPDRPITSVLMSPAETGSGVPEAVQGRHFGSCTASGTLVVKGHAVQGFPPALAMRSIDLRTADGLPRDAASLATAAEAAIAEVVAAGGHAVLHAIDGSKTGLVAPDRATCERLAAQFPGRLDVVVDACQARVEPAIVRRYLEQGFPVLVTGSKFYAAPGFCGAILFPRERLRRIAAGGCLPDGLGAYADLTEDGVSRRCPGLLMRWAAALHEMRGFAALPADAVREAIDRASSLTRAAIMRAERLRLIQAPRPPGPVWSGRRSVFTFAIRGPGGWLPAEKLRSIYVALSQDMSQRIEGSADARRLAASRCLLGQPVQLGGPAVGGLRIAFSAAQLAAGGDCRAELGAVFGKLGALLDNPWH